MIERRKTGLIRQVALLFAVGIIITGVLTFFSQRYLSETAVKRQTEVLAGAVADEVSLSVRGIRGVSLAAPILVQPQ